MAIHRQAAGGPSSQSEEAGLLLVDDDDEGDDEDESLAGAGVEDSFFAPDSFEPPESLDSEAVLLDGAAVSELLLVERLSLR